MKEKPKYQVLEEYIKDLINSGKLRVGDQVMTEKQLTEQFDMSRLTVNKALSNLAAEGVIERIQGKGSFVRGTGFISMINMPASFSEEMQRRGMDAGSQLLEYRLVSASEVPYVANLLGVNEKGGVLHYFVRLRTAAGEPMALLYTYLNKALVPDLEISTLNTSLYRYLDKIGIYRTGIRCKLSAEMPDEFQKKVLGIGNVAVLKNSHLVYTKDKQPFEYSEAFYISGKYAYEIETFY